MVLAVVEVINIWLFSKLYYGLEILITNKTSP